MADVANLWDERRHRLTTAVKDAVLALMRHTDAHAITIAEIDKDHPSWILLAGDAESLRAIVRKDG